MPARVTGINLPVVPPSSGDPASVLDVPSANMRVWFKANNIAGANGDTVTIWHDSGPHSNHASGTGTLRTSQINGRNAVEFNGSTNYFDTGSNLGIAANTDRTLYMVFNQFDNGTPRYPMGFGQPAVGHMWSINVGYSNDISVDYYGGVTNLIAFAAGVDSIYKTYESSGTQSAKINASSLSSVGGLNYTGSDDILGIGHLALLDPTGRYYGWLAELIIWDAYLDATNRGYVETYLFDKYALSI